MRLPYLKYSDGIRRYEQINFGGIDRRKASSDGSIYDMVDISTDDYPILSTVANRCVSDVKYEYPLYYGMADKPFVIAGNTEGGQYPSWISGYEYYKVGDIVGFDGLLYICKRNSDDVTDDTSTEISEPAYLASMPPMCATEYWDRYDDTTFQYDGVWTSSGSYTKDKIYLYEGKAYYCVNSHSAKDAWESYEVDWSDYDGRYRGGYSLSTTYYKGDIVCTVSGDIIIFYHYIFNYPQKNTTLEPSTHWELLEITIPVYDESVTYNPGDVVCSDVAKMNFERNIYGDSSPLGNNGNWKKYTYASLYYNGKRVEGLELIPGKKECSFINGYIVILPDKMFYNIYSGEYGYLKGRKNGTVDVESTGGSGFFLKGKWSGNRTLCWYLTDSNAYLTGGSGTDDTLVLIWDNLDTGGYSSHSLNYAHLNLTDYFKEGDVLEIRQNAQDTSLLVPGRYIVREVKFNYLRFDSKIFAGATINADYDRTGGNITYHELAGLVVSKDMPDIDYLCSCNNRMWGCKGDTVYASSLGNPFLWQSYTRLETDAAYLEAGTNESFTGCCQYGGYPYFFKENEMYVVYGSVPSNFYLKKLADVGIKKECSDSVCVVNSILMFLSPKGIYAYTGGIPGIMSHNTGEITGNCVASTDGIKYYAVMTADNKKRLYVYDTKTGIWSSEYFDTDAVGFVWNENELSCMDDNGEIFAVSKPLGNLGSEATEVKNKAIIEFNDFYASSIGTKDIGKVILRASVDPKYNALEIYVQYDSDNIWHRVGRIYNQSTRKKVCEFGFFPRRCDHFRIKLECQGKFTIYSMAREITNNA